MVSKMQLVMAILCFYQIMLLSYSASIGTSSPFIYFDQQLVEIGVITYTPSMDTIGGSLYSRSLTQTLLKMNKNLPNNYQFFCGWRGADFYYTTQSQGSTRYAVNMLSNTPTSIDLTCKLTDENKFYFITVNYILIHQKLVTSKIMYGKDFYQSPIIPCGGSGIATCTYPQIFSFPTTTTYQYFIALRYIDIYRDNDVVNKFAYMHFYIQIVNPTNINVKVDFGQNGQLAVFALSIVVTVDTLFDSSIMKNLILTPFVSPYGASIVTNPIVTEFSITTIHAVYPVTYFVGISKIQSQSIQFHLFFYTDPVTFILKGEIYSSNTIAYFHGFAFYGYTCAVGTYLSQANQVCEYCQDFCLNCKPNPSNQIQCLQCDTNFNLSPDKLTCQCPLTLIGTVCDNFNALNLSDCVNAQRVSSTVQCLFCSPILHKQLQNNQCVCMSGYNDQNNDGVCQETCGDGIVYQAQCDDGNTNPNDGCSPNCVVETGFKCDLSQPSYCQSLTPLGYKLSLIEKVQGQNKGKITLQLMNDLFTLPYAVESDQFRPQSSYVKLILILSQNPLQQMEITDVTLMDLTDDKGMTLLFDYSFTVENIKAKIIINYDKTRYVKTPQELKFTLSGVNNPLFYTSNLSSYNSISIVLCVGTGLSIIGLLIGLMTPKYIGLESILTLQLIFYSQLLISDPSKWPIGFVYLKYLKFSTGFNNIFTYTDYLPFSVMTKKFHHLQMQKSIVENFNINFFILTLSFIVFMVVFVLKTFKESQTNQSQQNRKNYDNKDLSINFNGEETLQFIFLLRKITQKVFWIVNHFGVWMILPIIASISSQLLIESSLVNIHNNSSFSRIILSLSPLIALLTIFIIFVINLNNFRNIWLSLQVLRKVLFKPQEQSYKRVLFIYLISIGMLVLFFNDMTFYHLPISIFILVFQVIYTLILVFIHPYRQSLRIHTITLFINQGVYIVFLFAINLINLVNSLNEIFVLILGYFITGCCGMLMILTGVRLYYELKYGQALEKQIQKQRERQEEIERRRKEEQLEFKKKKIEFEAKKKQSQKQMKRSKNQFLIENQVKQDQAKDVMEWLQKCNWQAELKQKYFYEKFTRKPLSWLKVNDKEEYKRVIDMKQKQEKQRKQRQMKKKTDEKYVKVSQRLKSEGFQKADNWQRKLLNHEKRIKNDMNYSMNVMRNENNGYIRKDYKLND